MVLPKAKDCWNKNTHEAMETETAGHLWRYIQKHSRICSPAEVFANITKLTPGETEMLAAVHLLMSERLANFLTTIAPEILIRLAKTVVSNSQVGRTGIRGRINWSGTYSRRLSEGLDPSLYVTADRFSSFDLPENRVFKFLLQKLYQTALSFQTVGELRSALIDERLLSDPDWKNRLAQITLTCAKLLKNVQLQKCSSIAELSAAMIRKSGASRHSCYRELAALAEECHLCFSQPEAFLIRYMHRHVLMPLEKNILYELAVLFKVIVACPENGWQEDVAALIGGKGKKVSTFKNGEAELHIYYQRLPEAFEQNSAYGPLMLRYDLSDRLRRPDIILEIKTSSGETRYFILEVKRSQERTYIADGVYKLLGYLKDYEAVRNDAVRVRGVLVSWSGTGISDYQESDEVYISQWSELDRLLKLVLT